MSQLLKKKFLNIVGKSAILSPILSFGLLLVTWEGAVNFFDVNIYILPSPMVIFTEMAKNADLLVHHALYTVWITFIGLLLACVTAVIMAIIMDCSVIFKTLAYPLILFMQTVPLISVAALFTLWFGFSTIGKLYVVVLICSFPIIVNLITGLKEIDRDYLDFFKTMGASKLQIYRYLKLPYGVGYFFAGLRIATTYAVLAAIFAEYMGGDRGLGIYLVRSIRSYNITMVFAIVLVGSAITLVGVGIVVLTEKLTLKINHPAL